MHTPFPLDLGLNGGGFLRIASWIAQRGCCFLVSLLFESGAM